MLPVDTVLPELLDALSRRSEAVLVAPPGAGKTTRVPPALLGAPWAGTGRIILLSPRRIAARAAAARMASQMGERVGETVGYRVRMDARVGANTQIEVVTEGVFTRLVQSDPELRGVAAVVFDEFHERSLDGDLGLALAREAQSALRPELRLLVMSATLDAARVAALLADAPVIVSEGRMHPVRLRYQPRDPHAALEDAVAAETRRTLAQETGSALVFLPGAREIERTGERLRAALTDPDIDVRPLYGAMTPGEQDAAIAPAPAGRRKVVLATSIAETSLTIEGVRIVIDSGLARRASFEPGLGLSRLETVRASQAAITQRMGRAGRLEPGVCVRLWSEGETRALPAFDRPEILDADLAGLALDLAAWGTSDPNTLAWLDCPPKPAWAQAVTLLKGIGALDPAGALTEHGRAVAALPLPPRLAHMVIVAARDGEGLLAAQIALVVSEQGLGGRDVDVGNRVQRLASERGARAEAARGLARRLAERAGARSEGAGDVTRAGALLALAFPDRVAKARGGGFQMSNGRAATIDAAEPLSQAPYAVIADIAGTAARARVLLAAPITLSEIEAMFPDRIATHASVSIDGASGAVRGRRIRVLGALTLSEAPLERLSGGELGEALLHGVREQGLALLEWDEAATQARARVGFMRTLEGDRWPDWSEAGLRATLDDWLAPALMGAQRLKQVNVAAALLDSLPYDLRQRLNEQAPARFETPAGSSLRIDYTADAGPALEVRLQELFGQDAHPSIARGRAPLTLRLLSPAHRPVQTTKDLPGFWRGSYASVRADLRGRYPKHAWPEDPLSAAPTRRAKPRGA